MSFSEKFIDKFKSGTFGYTDKFILMTEINKMSYCQFFDFVKSNFNVPHSVDISIGIWYTTITKKCNSCNNIMNITKNGSEYQYYKCLDCEKTYNFYNYDIDEFAFYRFIKNIRN